jgi:branched-chain amino acid transport system ATP-binding protein
VLSVRNLEVSYGDVQVLWGVNLDVAPNEMISLVGANGAGKSTLLKTISGLIRPKHGTITFDERDITRAAAQDIVALGIAQVPEGRRLFSGLSVIDNLMMGAYLRRDKGQIMCDLERVFGYFPRLRERQSQLAGKLSGGEQQMCAIGRALMSHPRMLLIDELSLGLAPMVVDELIEVLQDMRRDGMTVILVEQDIETALGLADRAYVLENGAVTLEGAARDLLNDDHVRAAYLGL